MSGRSNRHRAAVRTLGAMLKAERASLTREQGILEMYLAARAEQWSLDHVGAIISEIKQKCDALAVALEAMGVRP